MIDKKYKVLINGLHATGMFSVIDAMFPYSGSMEDRNTATIIFNTYLEDYCNENNKELLPTIDKLFINLKLLCNSPKANSNSNNILNI